MNSYSIIILSFVYWLFNVSVALVIDNGSGNAEQFLRRNRRLGSYHILAASGCFSCISAALRQLYTCIGAWLGDSANQQRTWLQWNSRGAGSGAVASQQIVHDKYLQGQGPTRSSFQDETVCLQQIYHSYSTQNGGKHAESWSVWGRPGRSSFPRPSFSDFQGSQRQDLKMLQALSTAHCQVDSHRGQDWAASDMDLPTVHGVDLKARLGIRFWPLRRVVLQKKHPINSVLFLCCRVYESGGSRKPSISSPATCFPIHQHYVTHCNTRS